MTTSLPPFLLLTAGALVLPFLPRRLRQAGLLALPILGGLNVYALEAGASWSVQIFDYQLVLAQVDPLSRLFGYLFHLAAFIGALFALHVDDRLQNVSAFVYAGAAAGVVFAGDWITLFIFWEVMTGASVFLIWARRSKRSRGAGLRYFAAQLVSGLLVLAGIVVHVGETGSTTVGFLGLDGLASILIFVGVGIKCGFPLVHGWLIDAYPEATPTGTVFLSAFTTKAAIYVLARVFPGTEVLIMIGAAMTLFPIFYAVIENDLRRVLSYSMINQLGFMVVGIGIGTPLGINGAVAHAFADVLFKGLLFMSMGALLHVTGRVKGSDLGGLYKTMPVTAGLCVVGALSIAGLPLFAAFATKAMVMQAALDQGDWIVWLALLFASAGVVEHAGIKIPFFGFFGRDSGLRAREPPWNMLAAMALGAILCIAIGSAPGLLYDLLPYRVAYAPYEIGHVITQTQILLFASLAVFALMVLKIYPPELRATNLDFDWLYRRIAIPGLRALAGLIVALARDAGRASQRPSRGVIVGVFRLHGPDGVFGRTWLTGNTVLWIAALLGLYLIVYYV